MSMKNPLTPAGIYLLFLYVYIGFYVHETRCPPIGLTHDREHEEMQECMGTWKLKGVDASWGDHPEGKS